MRFILFLVCVIACLGLIYSCQESKKSKDSELQEIKILTEKLAESNQTMQQILFLLIQSMPQQKQDETSQTSLSNQLSVIICDWRTCCSSGYCHCFSAS